MSDNLIITIDREYGSGGHDVGELLAKRLGIKFYDDELIDIAAEEIGFHKDYVRSNEEKVPGFSFTSMINSLDSISSIPSNNIQEAESKLIKTLAEQGSCVIVGRAADYILSNVKHVSVFLFAPTEERIKRIKKNSNVYQKTFDGEMKNDLDYERILKSTDKQRRKYYEFYTDNKWGDRDSYDILINTHRTGIEGATDIIETYIKSSKGKDLLSDLK